MNAFSRQLKFALDLVNSFARLAAEALASGRVDYAKELAGTYIKAQNFRKSTLWCEWECSTYDIFVKSFFELLEKGVI